MEHGQLVYGNNEAQDELLRIGSGDGVEQPFVLQKSSAQVIFTIKPEGGELGTATKYSLCNAKNEVRALIYCTPDGDIRVVEAL